MLPQFYQPVTLTASDRLQLDEDTSRHIVQVLRMQPGDLLTISDGNGRSATAGILSADKKRCMVQLQDVTLHTRRKPYLHMAVAFTKHAGRNEWLLEKMTEMGVHTIIPVMAARTERDKIRYDRWKNILAAAMIQSQQHYLPALTEAVSLSQLLDQYKDAGQKLMAHCMSSPPRIPLSAALKPYEETLVLIGPEGDFTPEEIALCDEAGFVGISLGSTRLRTETAAMAACVYFNLINHETA